jgi:hypothetical protein
MTKARCCPITHETTCALRSETTSTYRGIELLRFVIGGLDMCHQRVRMIQKRRTFTKILFYSRGFRLLTTLLVSILLSSLPGVRRDQTSTILDGEMGFTSNCRFQRASNIDQDG